jgi:G:T-mismatch repair DNA endonuclease (very short patch repair protein)
MEELHARTERRLHELRTCHGYEVHTMWQCELKERLRRDRQLKQWWDEIDVPGPLDVRQDALRGSVSVTLTKLYRIELYKKKIG